MRHIATIKTNNNNNKNNKKKKLMYLAIGAWNTLFGYGIFVALHYYLSNTIHYTIILTFSYIFSITNAFVGYKFAVFKSTGRWLQEYIRFYAVYGGAFVINIILLPLFVERLEMNVYLSQGLITLITVIGSYVFHNNYTFKGQNT